MKVLRLLTIAGLLWPTCAAAQGIGHRDLSRPTAPPRAAATLSVPTPPHPAVARIYVIEKDGQSLGSGTLIDVRDQYGLVVTNWHVIRDATGEISVVFPDGFRSAARVVKHDPDWDLAALSIWRPTAAPLRISVDAPKPGELLTIAGYGMDGTFRAVSAPCTQYVAPSNQHPHEIVELAATARQGDSGGPILNGRGELAGVLFGSAGNTTSGSYGPRVLNFLEPLIRAGAVATTPPGVAPQAPPVTTPPPATSTATRSIDDQLKSATANPTSQEAPADVAPAPVPAAALAPVIASESHEDATEEYRITHTPLSPRGPSVAVQSSPTIAGLSMQDLVGRTPIEQAKGALSVVGLFSLLMLAFRLSGRGPKHEE